MGTDRRYRLVVPEAVQRIEEGAGLGPADWYVRSSEVPVVINRRLERLLTASDGDGDGHPEPPPRAVEGQAPANGD